MNVNLLENNMILIDFKEKLMKALYEACVMDITSVAQDLSNESVFSYAIYCDSGFSSFGGAACSREGIKNYLGKNGNDSYLYAETFAAEWNYVNNHWQNFSSFDAINEDIIYAADDGDIEGIQIKGDFTFDRLYVFYIQLIVEVLNKLKQQQIVTKPPFESDLLLGLQFGDPSFEERKLMLQVSEQVNSPEWHKKMLEAYSK